MVPPAPAPWDGKLDPLNRKRSPAAEAGAGADAWRWGVEARVAAAEACGAALLVLVSSLGAGAGAGAGAGVWAGAATVGMLVQCFDHVSGAMMNPAVTLAALVRGRVGARRAALAAAAQLAGAAAGAAGAAGAAAAAAAGAGAGAAVTAPRAGLAPAGAAALEALAAACLALANCAAWDPRTRHLRDSWPLRLALTVAALSLATGEATGASMNPARSFGPALVHARWEHHWVYWVGPLSGALAAAVLYTALWSE